MFQAASRTRIQSSNALYPNIVEDYLNCFFPLDSSNPPFVQPASGSPRSPFHPATLHNRYYELCVAARRERRGGGRWGGRERGRRGGW